MGDIVTGALIDHCTVPPTLHTQLKGFLFHVTKNGIKDKIT